ncbi:MAG: circularly permuted type 2 ATP-grasp protein, partial [Bacteriovoracaceae bacterium]
MKIKSQRRKLQPYDPNQGFIGSVKVDVANYIFTSRRKRQAYKHSRPLVKNLLSREVSVHLKESRSLTRFIRKRDLTFQKSDENGNYKIFAVPCTTTIVPLQKSMFNTIEKAAQNLIVSLRCVIQDIYGSKSIKDSGFVKSLPLDIRKIFINAIMESPNYFPQLHHPNMKKYPFFDNVGLDLVLIEDFVEQSKNFETLLKNNKFDKIPNLPFKILELNAGAPSGASNNMNVLEGHYEQNPDVLDSMGKMIPNDHFQVLAETYKSLGESWTGIKDGIQVILPPGGLNGAAPEIHNLAAYSGLVYADPVQLFQDEKGYIRLRTINGSNPIVTAIYSRINADSALFDIEKDIILRDPDTNEPIYLRDSLKLGKDGEAPLVLDVDGKPIPLQSDYSVPGLLEAIIEKRIYMGGLNRILDNKIILATLTTYAPKYFAKKLKSLGLSNIGAKITPPETLPPKKESIAVIEKTPEDWVIKAPNLSGGSGIYIMKTLSQKDREEVLNMIRKNPSHYAYQKLVKIARIPVAMKDKEGTRFANLAADIRLWVFYGGGEKALPKMTHNALVRYAPEEKGPMSSIVNTSKGGGYAPFVVIDDVGSEDAVTAAEFIKPKYPVPLQTHLPMFVAAQLIQVGRLTSEIYSTLKENRADSYTLLGLALSLKTQCREVLSFLNPRAIEPIYKMIDLLEAKQATSSIAAYFDLINSNQIKLVSALESLERRNKLPKGFRDMMDQLQVLDMDIVYQNYTEQHRKADKKILRSLNVMLKEKAKDNTKLLAEFKDLLAILKSSINASFEREEITGRTAQNLIKLIEQFALTVRERLQNSEKAIEFSKIFDLEVS